MIRLNPFFEINGNRYELKRTRYIIAEYKRLQEENPLTDEQKSNALKATNLLADVRKFAEKEQEMWDAFCENPTPENKASYFMFKEINDEAIARYNDFATSTDTLEIATKHNAKLLEKVAIKSLAENYFDMNEVLARQIWDSFVESHDSRDDVDEWLNAMSECLFADDEEAEDNGFLAQKRKMDMERENNRKSAIRRKR